MLPHRWGLSIGILLGRRGAVIYSSRYPNRILALITAARASIRPNVWIDHGPS